MIDPQGGEMYQITLDLKQKPATIEHFFLLKKTIISLCQERACAPACVQTPPTPLEKKWGREASVNSLNNFPLQCTCGRIMRYQLGHKKL